MTMNRLSLLAALLTLTVWTTDGCGVPPMRANAEPTVSGQGLEAMPAWLEGAVVYGVVPPLFGEAPFQAVIERLDYLKEQGVDAIWLSPLNATDDPSAISYAVTDYLAIRPDFGTKEEFKRLVAEAHRRGMRVLMDFVPNHTSTGHPFYQDTVANGTKSKHWNDYVRDKSGVAQHYFDWVNLKNLNFDQPGVQAMMIDAFTYWVREMDVDGFRVDAAWGVKDRTPAFWPKLRAALDAVRPDVFLLAEASARDPYYVRNGFDAAYDWTPELGKWSWETVWAKPEQAGTRLKSALSGRETPPERVARFLNNNDTGARFITKFGLAQQRVAAVLLHTLPGIPIVYTGEEVGAEFEPYEDPPPLTWKDPHRLRPLYQQLAHLRATVPALRSGSWVEVPVRQNPGAYAFVRDAGAGSWTLVVLNFGGTSRIELELPAAYRPEKGTLKDLLSGKSVQLTSGKTTRVDLAKQGALVLAP